MASSPWELGTIVSGTSVLGPCGAFTYTKEAVVLRAVQELVQLVEGTAGRVPGQELLLLGQVADHLQGDVLGQEPSPGGGRKHACQWIG